MSTPVTPFIPPEPGLSPGPNTLPPLVSPPAAGERPGWPAVDMTNHANFPAGWPMGNGNLLAPGGPPGWPGMPQNMFNPAAMAGAGTNSYFIPPVALPGGHGGVRAHPSTPHVPRDPHTGMPADFIGWDNGGGNPAGMAGMAGMGNTPAGWPAPMQPTTPANWPMGMQATGMQATAQWPPSNHYVTPLMAPQMMPGGHSGGMPGQWPQAQQATGGTPWAGFGAMLGTPAAAAAPGLAAPGMHRRATSFGPQKEAADKMDRFAVGSHYGPVLDPFIVKVVQAGVRINPLLEPPSERHDPEVDPPYLEWNMLFHSQYCQRSSDRRGRSWMVGRDAPATFPRLSWLRLVSHAFHWMIEVKASDPSIGVTCGDVIDRIDAFMHEHVSGDQYKGASKPRQRAIQEAYQYNRSTADGVPGGRLGNGMRRLDWLGKDSTFGGIVEDDRYVREYWSGLPCTFLLECRRMFKMTPDEARAQRMLEEEEEMEERSRRHFRRSASRSRSRDR